MTTPPYQIGQTSKSNDWFVTRERALQHTLYNESKDRYCILFIIWNDWTLIFQYSNKLFHSYKYMNDLEKTMNYSTIYKRNIYLIFGKHLAFGVFFTPFSTLYFHFCHSRVCGNLNLLQVISFIREFGIFAILSGQVKKSL